MELGKFQSHFGDTWQFITLLIHSNWNNNYSWKVLPVHWRNGWKMETYIPSFVYRNSSILLHCNARPHASFKISIVWNILKYVWFNSAHITGTFANQNYCIYNCLYGLEPLQKRHIRQNCFTSGICTLKSRRI